MKKIFVILLGLSLVGAFFTASTFAANRSYSFRGSGSGYYKHIEKYSQTNKQTRLPRYSSRSRATRSNWNLLQKRNTDSRKTTERRVSTRSRGGAFATSAGQTAVTQSIRSMKDSFESFSAQNIAFNIDLPEAFSANSDMLEWESGEMSFKNGNARVTLKATGDRCDGGITFVRQCLKNASDAALKNFKTELPRMVLRRNESISLDGNKVQLQKENMGQYVDLYAREYGAGQLTFFDPTNEFVWVLQIIDPGNKTKLLSNNRDLNKIFTSLTQKTVISSKTSRTLLSTLFGSRNRSTSTNTLRKAPSYFGTNSMQSFMAEEVPFKLNLPDGFELLSDTLDKSMGEMSFQKGGELLEITATETVCNSQTSRLLQRCIEAEAKTFKKALQAEFPNAKILQDENMQVQLTDVSSQAQNFRRSSAFKSHIGRIIILRDAGARMGYFVFPEPNNGYIWAVRMEAPEDKDAFLNDIRQKTKILNSFFFETE
jgi:hypothetical protein